jgi:hypothetical protein
METVVIAVWVALAAAGAAFAYVNRNSVDPRYVPKQGIWSRAAQNLGLTCTIDKRGKPEISGVFQRFEVHLELVITEEQSFALRLTVDGGTAWPEKLSLGVGAPIFETGDPIFDGVVRIDAADHHELRAILDSTTRKRLHGALAGNFGLRNGQLWWSHDDSGSVYEIESWVKSAMEIARSLRRPGDDLPGRLLHIVKDESIPAVRREALKALAERFPSTRAHLDAARAATKSANAELRVLGAKMLGVEGLATFESVIRDSTADPALRVEAFDAALEIGGDRVVKDSQRELIDLLKAEGPPAVRAAEALGKLADPAVERALVDGLDCPYVETQIAMTRALAQIGSTSAVAPLLELTKGVFTSGALKTAAKDAIESIQSRAHGEPGALSLSEGAPEGGELSLAKTEGGGLAITEDS